VVAPKRAFKRFPPVSAGRRHLYIPDDLWSRLTSEAGTVGVRERGRAYSASEYACKLLAAGMETGLIRVPEKTDDTATPSLR
jgi:hypothetical protein